MKDILALLIVGMVNVANMACWTLLAINFDKWWIALFAILFVATIQRRSSSGTKSNDAVDKATLDAEVYTLHTRTNVEECEEE